MLRVLCLLLEGVRLHVRTICNRVLRNDDRVHFRRLDGTARQPSLPNLLLHLPAPDLRLLH